MATTKNALIVLLLSFVACRSPQPPTVKVVGLWPEAPPLSYKPFNAWTGGNYYIWPVVEAQPALRWETFPRPGETNDGFTAITYDLRIWRDEGGFPGDLVYRRNALPTASHRVEQPLVHGASYFWSVRARFQYRGQTQVTEWSRLESPLPADIPKQNGDSNYPDARYYRFRVR